MDMRNEDLSGLRLEFKDEAGGAGDEAQGGDTDVTAAVERLQAGFDAKMTEVARDLKAANDRADALEVKMNRPSGAAPDKGPSLERKAFTSWARHGVERMQADEVKSLRVADDTRGGFLAPGEFTTELLKDIVQFSPIREAARVGAMSVGSIKIPKRTGRITAQWVDEIEERPRTEPAYGMIALEAHEMSCYVDVSNQLLEDAAINIEAELSSDFAEEFGRLEGTAFVNGDGVKKPLGIMSDPAVPTLVSGTATYISSTDLIKLIYALPPAYRNSGSWLLNGSSIAAIRVLKDETGRFLWQDSLSEGQPSTLLGRPIVEAIDMPDIAAGATPILYGDIAAAYRVYDRVGLSVLRNPFTLDIYGQTRFTARRRVAGSVVRPEAVRKLRIATN